MVASSFGLLFLGSDFSEYHYNFLYDCWDAAIWRENSSDTVIRILRESSVEKFEDAMEILGHTSSYQKMPSPGWKKAHDYLIRGVSPDLMVVALTAAGLNVQDSRSQRFTNIH